MFCSTWLVKADQHSDFVPISSEEEDTTADTTRSTSTHGSGITSYPWTGGLLGSGKWLGVKWLLVIKHLIIYCGFFFKKQRKKKKNQPKHHQKNLNKMYQVEEPEGCVRLWAEQIEDKDM